MKSKVYLTIFSVLVGCSSAQKKAITSVDALDQLYQRGKSERIQGRPADCVNTFTKIIEMRKEIKGSLYAYSLYQAGLCYEMLEQYDRAIAVYQDALRVRAIMSSELATLEIPSRLAIVYTRIGEPSVADTYYLQTREQVKALKDQKRFQKNKEHYADVLFQMGTIASQYTNKNDALDFVSYLQSVRYSQEYLMLVVELEVRPYSEYALNQMVDNFNKTFELIKSLPIEKAQDQIVAERNRQNLQKEMSELLISHIDQFEVAQAVQKKSKNPNFALIFQKLKDIKSGTESLIAQRPIGEGLTPEAKILMQPRKDGQMVPVKE